MSKEPISGMIIVLILVVFTVGLGSAWIIITEQRLLWKYGEYGGILQGRAYDFQTNETTLHFLEESFVIQGETNYKVGKAYYILYQYQTKGRLEILDIREVGNREGLR